MRFARLVGAEVARFVGSRRGLVAAAGFALLWWLVLQYGIRPAGVLASGDAGLTGSLLAAVGLGALASWPAPQLAAWWVASLYLLPAIAVLAGADQTSSDRARGTLRLLSLRATRLEILLARWFGQCVVQAFAVLLTIGSTLSLIALDDGAALGDAIAFAPSASLAVWLTLLPWLALMSLVSALADTPRRATLYATILWITLSIASGWLQSRFGDAAVLDYALPGSQVGSMLAERDGRALALACIGLVHTGVFLALAAFVMLRRDL